MPVGKTTIFTGDANGIEPAYVRSLAARGDGQNRNLEHWLAGVVRMQAILEKEEQS